MADPESKFAALDDFSPARASTNTEAAYERGWDAQDVGKPRDAREEQSHLKSHWFKGWDESKKADELFHDETLK